MMRNAPESDDTSTLLPQVAWPFLEARSINHFLGTSYTVEEVQDMDPITLTILGALQAGLKGPTEDG